jgi:hypothetical protein
LGGKDRIAIKGIVGASKQNLYAGSMWPRAFFCRHWRRNARHPAAEKCRIDWGQSDSHVSALKKRNHDDRVISGHP